MDGKKKIKKNQSKKEHKLRWGNEKSVKSVTTLEQRGKKRKRNVQEQPGQQACKVKVA